jgi:hypothetical protein
MLKPPVDEFVQRRGAPNGPPLLLFVGHGARDRFVVPSG